MLHLIVDGGVVSTNYSRLHNAQTGRATHPLPTTSTIGQSAGANEGGLGNCQLRRLREGSPARNGADGDAETAPDIRVTRRMASA